MQLAAWKLGVGKKPAASLDRCYGVCTRMSILEINKLLTEPTLTGIYATHRFDTQGTSVIENINNIMGSVQSRFTSSKTIETAEMSIGMTVIDQNRK
jgi:hypothetical protein